MHSWNARQYLRFTEERTRPALDLLARGETRRRFLSSISVADRGTARRYCASAGPTPLSKGSIPRRICWKRRAAAIQGSTSFSATSPHGRRPSRTMSFFERGTAWVGNHSEPLPRLIAAVKPGGALAVQMPRNHDFATHALMRRVATEGPWRERLAGARDPSPVRPPEFDYDRLAPLSRRISARRRRQSPAAVPAPVFHPLTAPIGRFVARMTPRT